VTSLPKTRPSKRLGLLIDLDICVGCHACAVACKEWNTSGPVGPLSDVDPYGADPRGVWFCRVHTFEAGEGQAGRTVHYPRNCLHCENAQCVTVCPTGASYKRESDGIVLVDTNKCIGCKLCAWACPYGAREFDEVEGVMKKCTLCVDRIYSEALPESERIPMCVRTCPTHARHFGDFADPDSFVSRLAAERGVVDPLPELGYRPTCHYLPQRTQAVDETKALAAAPGGLSDWLNAFHRR
jgi:Fe-S-cluster-containing dehydrogenase component